MLTFPNCISSQRCTLISLGLEYYSGLASSKNHNVYSIHLPRIRTDAVLPLHDMQCVDNPASKEMKGSLSLGGGLEAYLAVSGV